MVSLNRLSPRYILYSNHNNDTRVRNQKNAGAIAKHAPKKEMKTLVSRRSDEALQSDQSQPTPSRRETPSTQRCCPDQMVLGFPPAQSKVDKGFPRCPPGRNGATRKRHRVRVKQANMDFSRPSPQKNSAAMEHHHQASPPTSMRHHGLAVIIPVSLKPMTRGL
jgi:hypothetical protein